ncbi:putative cadmium/zinc-transporting ATPase 3 [Hordeum vulgare]|nr:putative cadmium/zinc-transporting ATPase 3 [Hordeum vulgare]
MAEVDDPTALSTVATTSGLTHVAAAVGNSPSATASMPAPLAHRPYCAVPADRHYVGGSYEGDEGTRLRQTKKSVVIEDEKDVAGEERRRPPPHSATKSYRPNESKKVKGAKAGDNDLKEGFDAIVMARKVYAEEKRMLKLKEIEEKSEAEAAAEEKRAAAKDMKVDLAEKKAAVEEMKMIEEKALKFMSMDTSTPDPRVKAYVKLCRGEMLVKKQMLMRQ